MKILGGRVETSLDAKSAPFLMHLPDPDPESFRRNDFVGAAFEFSEVHGQIGRPMTTVENRKALRIFACNDPKTVFPYALSSTQNSARAEERRVGKESVSTCRSR